MNGKPRFVLIVLMILLMMNIGYSQNIVLNPSFEDTLYCTWGSVNASTGWDAYRLSPDYFHSCSVDSQFSVPNNWGGYQPSASGSAYCAFGTYSSHIYSQIDVREFIGGQLSTPLLLGEKYYVSFKVSLSLSDIIESNCASNKIGAMFSTVPYTFSNPSPLTNNPPIFSDSIVLDTIGWTRIFGSFIADSAYQYIIIGNFFDDNNIDTLIMNTDSNCLFSYYYLDDVCVSTDSFYSANWNYTNYHFDRKNLIKIYPNPAHDIITIDFQDFGESYATFKIRIFNVIGQELYHRDKAESQSIQIDVSNIYDGIFFIQIITQQNRYFNYRFVKL